MKKRPSKIKPQTWTAASEAPPGAERPPRVNPCLSISFHPQISPNFGPQFLRMKYGKSPQFLRRNRIWILPVEERRATNQADRSFYTAVNSHCTQNRGYTDTFFDCFWFCLIDTVKLVVGKQVSDRETQGQNGNSAENLVGNGHIENSW